MTIAGSIRWFNPLPLLFGPIYSKEMAVGGRRWSTYLVRMAVCLLLLVVTGVAMLGAQSFGLLDSGWNAIQRSKIAIELTYSIGWTQVILSAFVGIVSSASAISDEKTNRTLASLASTPLTSSQIVFGKLASRLAELALLNLVPIPLLLLLRVYGGVDPWLVLSFAYAAITLGALGAAIATFFSCFIDRPFGVIFLTGFAVGLIEIGPTFLTAALSSSAGTPPDWVGYVLASLSVPIGLAFSQFGSFTGSDEGYIMLLVAGGVHIVGSVGLGVLTSILLRRIIRSGATKDWGGANRTKKKAHKEAETGDEPSSAEPALGSNTRQSRRLVRERSRHVSDRPVLWRESRRMLTSSRRTAIVGGVIFSLIMLYLYVMAFRHQLMDNVHHVLLFLVVILLLLLSTLAPASLIAGEKARRTWDVLLTTPLTIRQILWQKLLGTLVRPWLLLVALSLHYVVFAGPWASHRDRADLPVLLGGLFLIMVPWTMACGAVGLFWSAMCKTARTAASLSFLTVLAWWLFIPFVVAMLLRTTRSFGSTNDRQDIAEYIFGLSNPVVLVSGLAEAGLGGGSVNIFGDSPMAAGEYMSLILASSIAATLITLIAIEASRRRIRRTGI